MSEHEEAQWWMQIDGVNVGPYTSAQIKSKILDRSVDPSTKIWARGNETAQVLENISEFAVVFRRISTDGVWRQSSELSRYLLMVLAGATFYLGKAHRDGTWPFNKTKISPVANRPRDSKPRKPVKPQPTPAANPITHPNNTQLAPQARVARLSFSWQDGTNELITLVQDLTPEQSVALGFTTVASNADIYGLRITFQNTGNVPLRIDPVNLAIHHQGQKAMVYTLTDLPFLQAQVLQPGASVSGLVTYIARTEIGAAIRAGGGVMSYNDPTIEVSYE